MDFIRLNESEKYRFMIVVYSVQYGNDLFAAFRGTRDLIIMDGNVSRQFQIRSSCSRSVWFAGGRIATLMKREWTPDVGIRG